MEGEREGGETERLRRRVAELEGDLARATGRRARGIRRRSSARVLGVPLYEIAVGPHPESGEERGHARAIFAAGDLATGVFAFGGMARGVFAFGGLAMGLVTFGGCSIGLVLALGGLAVGGVALGGCAAGFVAVGGAAFGYYAVGGGVFGIHTIGPEGSSPQAVDFFRHWLGWVPGAR